MKFRMFRSLFAISALLILLFAPIFVYPNGPGNLDLTFAGVGYKYDGFPGGADQARKVAIQPDGKVVVAGYTSPNGSGFNVALTRYNPDGTLDTTFSDDGKVVTSFGHTVGQGNALAIQPDGKIVVAGFYQSTTTKDFLVLRYNTDGTIDTTFDGDGKAITPIRPGFDDQAIDLIIQPDGKIVAAGTSGTNPIPALVRYLSSGSLDTTFDSDGIALMPLFGYAYSLIIQADGKIVIAGESGGDFTLFRVNSNGSLDNTFDGDGVVKTPILAGHDVVLSLALESGGKIVAAGGAFTSGSDADFALARYNPDGSLDTSFDGDGKFTTTFSASNVNDSAGSVAIQPDGKIVAAGHIDLSYLHGEFALLRLNPDGSFDTSFDGDGKVITDVLGHDAAYSLVIQPDGKMIAAGTTNHASNDDFGVVRYNANGSLDTSFDGDGIAVSDVGRGISIGQDVVVQPDGRIVTLVYAPANHDFGLIRYTPDGAPDPSFGVGGKAYTVFSGLSSPSDMLLQPDGKIVAVGRADSELNARFGLARFNPDGSLDTSFDGDGKVVTAIPNTLSSYASIAELQPDGKIVVLGNATFSIIPTTTRHLVIARYNTDGTLDASFDGDGFLAGTSLNGLIEPGSIAVQPDGKILVGGSHNNVFALVRYNPDGSVDTTFGTGGIVSTPIQPGGTSNAFESIALLPDGRIVAGGDASNGSNLDFVVARYHSDGSLDTSFDGDGKAITPILSGNDRFRKLAIQSDGRIVATGDTNNGTNTDMALVRYNVDGSLDTTYGLGGKAIINLGLSDSFYSLALDAANNAVAIGASGNSEVIYLVIARITANFAPLVDIGGRITSMNGQGIGGATVVLTNASSVSQTARTNAFGYYSFSGVSSNEIYTVHVSSKRYRFQPSSQSITVLGSLSNVDFVGNPGSESKNLQVRTGSGSDRVSRPVYDAWFLTSFPN